LTLKKTNRLLTAPAKQHVGQEAAENLGEITSDFTGQAQRKKKKFFTDRR
jgi:hypothetical protein